MIVVCVTSKIIYDCNLLEFKKVKYDKKKNIKLHSTQYKFLKL